MPYNNSYRQLWVDAGYRSDMGSTLTGTPPSSEYIRLYHLITASHAINNIAMGRLKVARFSDVNDPFELMALNMKYGNVRKVVGDFKEKVNNEIGILCFSEDWTSPVMWSHYAEKHTGICLGFDVLRASVQKIDYADKRLLEGLGESDEPYGLTPDLQKILLHTKCHEWKYEEEYRKVVELPKAIKEGNLYFWSFDTDIILVEVILGQYCNLSLDNVRNLVDKHYPHTNTFKARLAFKHFKVVPNLGTVL